MERRKFFHQYGIAGYRNKKFDVFFLISGEWRFITIECGYDFAFDYSSRDQKEI